MSADVGAPARDQEQTVTRQTPSRKPSGYLTRREREAADLMAQGLTNRQIATRLVITERTAETHARHVLSKLGLSSRAQLIPSAAERRVVAASADRQAQSA